MTHDYKYVRGQVKKDGKFAYKADLCSVIRVAKAFESITNYNMYIIILCNEQKLLFKLLHKKYFNISTNLRTKKRYSILLQFCYILTAITQNDEQNK